MGSANTRRSKKEDQRQLDFVRIIMTNVDEYGTHEWWCVFFFSFPSFYVLRQKLFILWIFSEWKFFRAPQLKQNRHFSINNELFYSKFRHFWQILEYLKKSLIKSLILFNNSIMENLFETYISPIFFSWSSIGSLNKKCELKNFVGFFSWAQNQNLINKKCLK